jgi:DNA repair exonuclease SbcCD ATPase subunit
MFRVKHLTVKNFMSVGNATQAVNFDRKDLTLVLGENIDLGGDDSGARNGTGKTTIINALSYALYGTALTNIRKDNLINKTNAKGMLVTIEFEVNGVDYKIERGRKSNVLKFYIGEQEQESKDDNSQGDSRETQAEIERLLGMSHDMFKHIVALNTYTEPFLSLKSGDQRAIIEQLLGITLLSEKADALKEQQKASRDAITAEEYKIKAIAEANERIKEQIESLCRRQGLWVAKHQEEIIKLSNAIEQLSHIDIDIEIESHKALTAYNQKRKDIDDIKKYIVRCEQDLVKEEKIISKLEAEIADLKEHKCYACGQTMHDSKHEEVLQSKEEALKEAALQYLSTQTQLVQNNDAIKELGELGAQPKVFYDKEEDAIHHRSTVANLQSQLEQKHLQDDPYTEQIEEMRHTALAEIDYSNMNELVRVREHQEFLYKLLTNKDSYIRKRIIDQNLSYLNARLSYYLDKIGLPHQVKFLNDLSVEIQELGRELDFDNLSRGERNRLILSLSWAFRDVWESLYQPINLLFIDELVDSGMDTSGVENALAILKKMTRENNKSIWLVSHKDELAGRVNNILTVVKENGFTTYNNDVVVK